MQIWHDVIAERAEIIVRDYEAIRQARDSVVTDLLQTIGLGELRIAPGERQRNIGIHPTLVEAYIAVRASNQEFERKLVYFDELQTISRLIPKIDGAAFHLGEHGKAGLRDRLNQATNVAT